MKTLLLALLTCTLLLPAFAAKDEKEEDRVKESGVVLKEILNIPDDIPQDLLDKAECVLVLPSVKKAAFRHRGKLWSGSHDLPKRPPLHRVLGKPRSIRLGRTQHRVPTGRRRQRISCCW